VQLSYVIREKFIITPSLQYSNTPIGATH